MQGSPETGESIEALKRELNEARQQQAATADVLKVISRSAFDLKAVLRALVESARDLCNAPQGMILLRDGDVYRTEMQIGYPPEFEAYILEHPILPNPYSGAGRAAFTGEVVHFPDVLADPDYRLSEGQRLGKYRTMLSVPLVHEKEVIGVFSLGRTEPAPFTQRQIDLVATFADQALIAIENARLFEEVQARTHDLTEALQQQTATADVLKVISGSAFDLQVVLDTLVGSAARLCDADRACIFQRKGDLYHWVSNFGFSPELVAYADTHPFSAGPHSTTSRVALECKTIHNPDVLADPNYAASEYQRLGDYRTMLGVPLLREGAPVGVFILTRSRVRPFTERQIEVVQSFADQAVIAIENVRLFHQVEARTRDVSEALQQQTATADVLKVISRSAFDLRTVLATLTRSASELCGATQGIIFLRDGDVFRAEEIAGASRDLVKNLHDHPIRAGRGSVSSRVALSGAVEQIADVLADPEYALPALRQFTDTRAVLGVPLLRDGRVDGIFVLGRDAPGAFTQRQIEVVQTFADQAVIAIENVRLFEEVRARTRDLSEALQQQTATADVLKVISRSAFDLQAVFDTLIASAVELCGANRGAIFLRDGDVFPLRAASGSSREYFAYWQAHPARAGRGSATARVILSGMVESIPDVLDDAEMEMPADTLIKIRATLGVPLLRDSQVEGVLVLTRPQPGDFTPRQVELVQTFADQAVIAIENVRLFEEVQARTRDLSEALQQQTATSEVLKVISRSTFGLKAVFQTLIDSAVRLCAKDGVIYLRHGDVFLAEAAFDADEERLKARSARKAGRDSITGRVALSGSVEQIPDNLADLDFTVPPDQRLKGIRALLGVPLLRDGKVEGVFVLGRAKPGFFTERQIELVRTFADQAVIAIENVRLFEQVQARTDELARSLNELRGAQDRLVQTEKLASLGQLTAGIAHEIKNPLNFINNFSELSRDLLDELNELVGGTGSGLDEKARDEVTELTGMIKSNLDKVVQHGRRADSIVKNMLLHSREGGGERRSVDLNAVVEESLNLAYHGARAERPGFNITLAKDLDPAVGRIDLYPQEFTRVLLNLISNGFYAAFRKKNDGGQPGFEPSLAIATKALPDHVEIRVRDNGIGIPDAVRAKMFNPFFTTKPAGEGTGLGLSLSHDIVVKQHGGSIEVDTSLGEFTEFTIALPRAASSAASPGSQP